MEVWGEIEAISQEITEIHFTMDRSELVFLFLVVPAFVEQLIFSLWCLFVCFLDC